MNRNTFMFLLQILIVVSVACGAFYYVEYYLRLEHTLNPDYGALASIAGIAMFVCFNIGLALLLTVNALIALKRRFF